MRVRTLASCAPGDAHTHDRARRLRPLHTVIGLGRSVMRSTDLLQTLSRCPLIGGGPGARSARKASSGLTSRFWRLGALPPAERNRVRTVTSIGPIPGAALVRGPCTGPRAASDSTATVAALRRGWRWPRGTLRTWRYWIWPQGAARGPCGRRSRRRHRATRAGVAQWANVAPLNGDLQRSVSGRQARVTWGPAIRSGVRHQCVGDG